jgi:ribosome modulation factor
MEKIKTQEEIIQEGYQAFVDALNIDDCPYKTNENMSAWKKGYTEAENDYFDALDQDYA